MSWPGRINVPELREIAPATIPVVEMSGLGRSFGADPPVNALIDVNLTVHPGEWVSIIGPSGSGKSTLLNIIGCLDRHTAGSYRLNGSDVAALSDKQRAGVRARSIGFVFQSFHLLTHRSVTENVMLAEVYRRSSFKGRAARAMAALEQVGLADRADFMPTRLSGGERQRVAIARALLCSPSLLLCDEPTGNLDSENTVNVLELFDVLHRAGMTILMITHEPAVAARTERQARIIDGVLEEL